jgi:hypothetical protein
LFRCSRLEKEKKDENLNSPTEENDEESLDLHRKKRRKSNELDEDEPTIYNLTPDQLECINKLRSTCNTFRRTAIKQIKNQQQQTKKIEQTLKTLSKENSIVITRPDKGRGIVILNKHDYIKKMNDILSDTTTFKELDHDPTIKQENKLNSKLLELKNDNFITLDDYNYARSRGSQPGRIYGLPKIHKTVDADGLIPLRPIVSSSNTYNYRLAKLLANKLDYLRKNSTIVNTVSNVRIRIKSQLQVRHTHTHTR